MFGPVCHGQARYAKVRVKQAASENRNLLSKL